MDAVRDLTTSRWPIRPLWAFLHCPVCDDPNVHPRRVEVNQNGRVVDISRYGIGHDERKKGLLRGSEIRLEFYCEQGDIFSINLRFHKGATTVWAEQLGHWEGDWPTPELWRD